ncbi:MAG: DGQHR domain-containing protein, partial [Nitrosopumilus sp.]
KEKAFRRKQRTLKSNIRNMLKRIGFEYLRTEDKHKIFDKQKGEFDSVYLYENIILLCEDSLDKKPKDHIKSKSVFFNEVENNFDQVLDWLKNEYADKFKKFDDYPSARYKHFFLYFHPATIDEETQKIFPNIRFIDQNTLKYFQLISNTIMLSAMNELFKFLNLTLADIGSSSSGGSDHTIESSVILPEYNSGYKGVQIVSFLMRAEDLMQCAYVLRKENWEDSMYLYQRLIKTYRIKNIRKFVGTQKKAFINNIIVSLPSNVEFSDYDGNSVKINKESEFRSLKIRIKKEINSIGIIDGQHRVFAHYRAPKEEKYEKDIAMIRSKLHLLVTGLIFPSDIAAQDKRKAESDIFLQINSNQRKVRPSLLQHIEALKEFDSPIGIANQTLKKLNKRSPFLGLLQMSEFESSKIRTPSILKYGLKDFVEINDKNETLYKYWDNSNKNVLKDKNGKNYKEIFDLYVEFCTNIIAKYFSAVKSNYQDDWVIDKNKKLLTATSIIALLIALKKSLSITGKTEDFEYYRKKFSKLTTDFNKGKFRYISSHWNHFVEEISKDCWEGKL